MDVFGAGIEVRPLKAPGCCFICEGAPQQDAEKVINTMRIFSPGPVTNLNGTKYVCESCAHDLGVAVGLVDAKEHQQVVDLATEFQTELADANSKLAGFTALQTALDTLAPAAPVEVASEAKKA